VETGEFRIGGFLLVIIFTGINAAIEVREQFGNRLDALVVLTGWRIQGFRFFDIPAFTASVKALVLVTRPAVSVATQVL
jgi:hypothetical protein